MKLPNKKINNYVEQEANGELLIYNLTTDQAHCLNSTSAVVFSHCNGATSFDELQKKTGFESDLIYLTLDELKRKDLIEGETANPFAGLSRREVIKRVGLASMVALPVIASLIAPPSSHAASTCTPGRGTTDLANGSQGRNSQCGCGNPAGNRYGFQNCNTTRGGQPDISNGCKSGCLCKSDLSRCFSDGLCYGTCG